MNSITFHVSYQPSVTKLASWRKHEASPYRDPTTEQSSILEDSRPPKIFYVSEGLIFS